MISHKDAHLFESLYFERGLEAGVSLYENYRWQPERSVPMAETLKLMYPGKTVLDFGCAKGFLVRALLMVGVEAYGFDISTYALSQSDEETRKVLSNDLDALPDVDLVFAKDTLEHIRKPDLPGALQDLRGKCKEAFAIVPMGDGGEYRIPDYMRDLSHRIAEDEDWWSRIFKTCGFRVVGLHHRVSGFKENWADFKKGNAFYFLKSY